MEKSYQTYLKRVLNEAGDYNPVLSHSGSGERQDPNLTKKYQKGIQDAISSLPELAPLNKYVDELTNIVANGVKSYEFDVEGNKIDPTRENGVAAMSQNFRDSNPFMKSLYLLAMSKMSGHEFEFNPKIPFYLLTTAKKSNPNLSLSEIAKIPSDEWSKFDDKLQSRNSKLADSFNQLIQSGRFKPLSANTTISGIDVGKTKPSSKSKLIDLLHQLDREQFDINASTFGANYQSVAKENDIINDYLKSKIPQSTINKNVGDTLSTAKKQLLTSYSEFMGNVGDNIKDAVTKEITTINNGIKGMEDAKEIAPFVREHIKGIQYPKSNRDIQRTINKYYAPFLSAVGKINIGGTASGYAQDRNQSVLTPIPPKAMKAIIKTLWEYNRDILTSNTFLNAFIERNYPEDQDPENVSGFFHEYLRKGGVTRDEPSELEGGDDTELAKDIGVPVAQKDEVEPKAKPSGTASKPINFDDLKSKVRVVSEPKDRGPVGDLRKKRPVEPKTESFYDKMVDMINE